MIWLFGMTASIFSHPDSCSLVTSDSSGERTFALIVHGTNHVPVAHCKMTFPARTLYMRWKYWWSRLILVFPDSGGGDQN